MRQRARSSRRRRGWWRLRPRLLLVLRRLRCQLLLQLLRAQRAAHGLRQGKAQWLSGRANEPRCRLLPRLLLLLQKSNAPPPPCPPCPRTYTNPPTRLLLAPTRGTNARNAASRSAAPPAAAQRPRTAPGWAVTLLCSGSARPPARRARPCPAVPARPPAARARPRGSCYCGELVGGRGQVCRLGVGQQTCRLLGRMRRRREPAGGVLAPPFARAWRLLRVVGAAPASLQAPRRAGLTGTRASGQRPRGPASLPQQ